MRYRLVAFACISFFSLAGCGDSDSPVNKTISFGVDLYDNGNGTGEVYYGNGGYSEVIVEDGRAFDLDTGEEYIIDRRFEN